MKWLNLSGLAYFWGRIQTALSKKVDAEMIGQPSGAAGLDAGGKVPVAQLPAMNYVPTTRKVNGKALSSDIALTAGDVGARPDNWMPTAANVGAVPTTRKVNNKALSADITLTASDVNAAPTTRKVNGKALSADITLTAADVGASGKRVARFTVGTSTAGWTAADCDYLCDGTDDQTEINAAITALPATGGEVVILDGTYNVTAKIDVTKDNVSIRGNGNATILKRMFNSSVEEGVITLKSRSGCKIANLQVDGNKASYNNRNNAGIYLDSSSNNTVTGNTCNNNNHGISLYSSSNNTITGNTCNNNNSGIYLDSSSSNNTVTGNTCNNNNSGIYLDSSSNNTVTGNTCNNNNHGIYLDSSSNNTVTGNTCNSNNYGIYLDYSSSSTVTGNTCNNNSSSGINLHSLSSSTVTGNTCNNNSSSGISLHSLSNNTITGNTFIRGTGLATDYTVSQHTIRLIGTNNRYNLISNNNCMGKAVTNEGGTGNTLVNNKYNAT